MWFGFVLPLHRPNYWELQANATIPMKLMLVERKKKRNKDKCIDNAHTPVFYTQNGIIVFLVGKHWMAYCLKDGNFRTIFNRILLLKSCKSGRESVRARAFACVCLCFNCISNVLLSVQIWWDEIAMTNATCRQQQPIMFGLRGLHTYKTHNVHFIFYIISLYWGNPNLTILLGLFILLSRYNCEIYSRCIPTPSLRYEIIIL